MPVKGSDGWSACSWEQDGFYLCQVAQSGAQRRILRGPGRSCRKRPQGSGISDRPRAKAAPHNCHGRDGGTSVTVSTPTPPPATRTGVRSCPRSWGELLYPQHFKYRAYRRKFYPQFPVSPAMSPAPLQTQHAAVLYGSKDLRYEERTLWPPRQNEAQVKVVATGLCGSDRTFPL